MIKNNTNFKAIIEKSDYLIFNTDIKENIELLENLTLNLLRMDLIQRLLLQLLV